MALPERGGTPYYSLLLIYRPQKDEMLSWPSWLTYNIWFTDIGGHPSAASQTQDKESWLSADERPVFYHCATA